MSSAAPYNPLQKKNLAESIVRAILDQEPRPLVETDRLGGAGVYILYYRGASPLYPPFALQDQGTQFEQPIYVGKAVPKGGSKGGFTQDDSAMRGTALRDRLGQHLASVSEATNLLAADFVFRALVVDEIFIPLGENMLIERFKPVWNLVITGFGNKDPGQRRKSQYRSAWDVLHPGRRFADKLGDNPNSTESYVALLNEFYRTGSVIKAKRAAGISDEDLPENET